MDTRKHHGVLVSQKEIPMGMHLGKVTHQNQVYILDNEKLTLRWLSPVTTTFASNNDATRLCTIATTADICFRRKLCQISRYNCLMAYREPNTHNGFTNEKKMRLQGIQLNDGVSPCFTVIHAEEGESICANL
jgi:hypothetical protein